MACCLLPPSVYPFAYPSSGWLDGKLVSRGVQHSVSGAVCTNAGALLLGVTQRPLEVGPPDHIVQADFVIHSLHSRLSFPVNLSDGNSKPSITFEPQIEVYPRTEKQFKVGLPSGDVQPHILAGRYDAFFPTHGSGAFGRVGYDLLKDRFAFSLGGWKDLTPKARWAGGISFGEAPKLDIELRYSLANERKIRFGVIAAASVPLQGIYEQPSVSLGMSLSGTQ